jgi:hypothetical protein
LFHFTWPVSFVDAQVKHSGQASLRLENFTANTAH